MLKSKANHAAAIFLLAALVLAALPGCEGKQSPAVLQVNFVHDYSQGMARAKSEGKPIMLVFDAAWCGYCKQLKQNVFSDPKVGDASQRLVNILVDIDKDKATAAKYKVRGVPAVFFMDPSGAQVMPYEGPRSPDSFTRIMQAFADRFSSRA